MSAMFSSFSDTVSDKIGNLNVLTTTDKSSAVAAVNEVNGKISAIKDGTNIDSFSDVESALATKANTSAIPTKTSQLTNDSGYITNSVNNLSNYYTKSSTYTKTEVDNKINTIGSYTTATGTYTTASWAIGKNTCIWKAPSAGTYLVWMSFWLKDESKSYIYKQFHMQGTATRLVADLLFYEGEGDRNNRNTNPTMQNTISQPIVATAANQTIIPYVHTDEANVPFDIKIVGVRIK